MHSLWSDCDVVQVKADLLGSAPAIRGTRIPVAAIFKNMESGATIEDLVEWFSGLTEDDVKELLKFAANSAVNAGVKPNLFAAV